MEKGIAPARALRASTADSVGFVFVRCDETKARRGGQTVKDREANGKPPGPLSHVSVMPCQRQQVSFGMARRKCRDQAIASPPRGTTALHCSQRSNKPEGTGSRATGQYGMPGLAGCASATRSTSAPLQCQRHRPLEAFPQVSTSACFWTLPHGEQDGTRRRWDGMRSRRHIDAASQR